MFIPKIFNQQDKSAIIELILENPLATVVYTDTNHTPQACHIPIVYVQDEQGERLIGHVHRSNTLWQNADKPWLLIFTGASHYISPNWYPSKPKTHKEVPTYNYQAVHLRVQATITHDLSATKEILAHTTQFFEQQLATTAWHEAWELAHAPQDFVDKMCAALVAFEMSVLEIQAAFKLSQNKATQDKLGIIQGLNALGTPQAKMMATKVNSHTIHSP